MRLARCRYEAQLTVHADDLSRDYFELWQLVARRGSEQADLEARGAERLDYFATQLGRLEGIADALILAGRDRQHVAVGMGQEDAVLTLLHALAGGPVLEPPAQLRDERLNALRRARRRLRTPEVVDDLLDGHDLVRAQQEQGEKGALLMPAEREALTPVLDLEPTEDAEIHAVSPPFASNLAPRQPAA